jgi:hypothetical protein
MSRRSCPTSVLAALPVRIRSSPSLPLPRLLPPRWRSCPPSASCPRPPARALLRCLPSRSRLPRLPQASPRRWLLPGCLRLLVPSLLPRWALPLPRSTALLRSDTGRPLLPTLLRLGLPRRSALRSGKR